MKPEELWTAVDYWNDLQKGDLEVETYIRVGDELAEYATLLEAENAALSELLSPLVDVEMERDIAMSENQRLTKHVEDYEDENATLKGKLLAIECAGCGKTMMECECDEVE